MANDRFSIAHDIALITERLRSSCLRYKQDAIIDSGWYESAGYKEQHTYYVNGPPDDDRVDELMLIQQADGSWPGLGYPSDRDDSEDYWQKAPQTHMLWTLHLAEALSTQESRHYENPACLKALSLALGKWLSSEGFIGNLWWREIGCPRWLSRVLLLCRSQLDEDMYCRSLALFAARLEDSNWGNAYNGMPQTQVWLSELLIYYGCLTGNGKFIGLSREAMTAALDQTGNEGLQRDFSFQQSGPILSSGFTGYYLALDTSRIAWLLHGTQFGVGDAALDTIRLYMLEHQQWIVRGQTYDPGVLGPEIGRPGRSSARLLVDACDNLLRINALMDDEELRAMRDRLLEPIGQSVSPLFGSRVFWRSDYVVHQRQEFFASLRMLSTRTRNATPPRALEGIASHHMADGALFIMCHSREYDRVFPGWNWRRIPGTTAAQSGQPMNPDALSREGGSAFAGGATDGVNCCAGFKLHHNGLSAKKSWFFIDHTIICLGSNITDRSGQSIYTSLDQCRLVGDAIVGTHSHQIMAYRPQTLDKPKWLWHDHVGYVMLEPARVGIDPGPRQGDWGVCNGQRAGQTESTVLLDAWIDHGVHPTDAHYGYAVLPGSSCDDLDRFLVTPGCTILRKDAAAHAVYVARKGLVLVVCFEPCTVHVPDWSGQLSLSTPCALLVQHRAGQVMVWASSPEHAAGELKVELAFARGPKITTQVHLTLPTGLDAGSTVGTGVFCEN